jgi:hypothetical protein
MVWMGVYSQSFLAPVSKVSARVLVESGINVPVRAAVTPAGGPVERQGTYGATRPIDNRPQVDNLPHRATAHVEAANAR